MQRLAVPKLVTWLAVTGLILLALMTVLRLVLFFQFKSDAYNLDNTIDAFILGFRFDLKIVSATLLLPLLVGSIQLAYTRKKWLTPASLLQVLLLIGCMFLTLYFLKATESPFHTLIIITKIFFGVLLVWIFLRGNCDPFERVAARRVFNGYFLLLSFAIVLLYMIDFYHYDFLHERVNASVWNYTANAAISLQMVWESYPVLILMAILVVLTVGLYGLFRYLHRQLSHQPNPVSFVQKSLFTGVFALALVLGIFGNFNVWPPKVKNALQWNDAFAFQDDFKASLSLNPVYSFLATLQYGNSFYDLAEVKAGYPLLSAYLGVEGANVEALHFDRYTPVAHSGSRPNVVIVICESFSAFKSSMWGNRLNTTPYFNELCSEGVFFDRCFTPGYGTSQGVWATITGIPDVEHRGTASQNPAYVDQRSIVNDFVGYKKFYFVGGASGWANLRGLFDNNLDGIQIFDERNLNTKILNAWGVSDKNLFLKADSVFQNQTAPFFAVIQTSTNHSPFDFDPEDLDEFHLKTLPPDTLMKYGFKSNEEMNAFRYTDFSFEKFMETAKQRNYFPNTLFVFVGDHGKGGLPPGMFPKAWELAKLGLHHVPLLFYAPRMLKPQRNHTTVSQLDVLPSVAALANIPFTNATLGQNLFDTHSRAGMDMPLRLRNPRFLFNSTVKTMGMVTDDWVYIKNFITGGEEWMSSVDDRPVPETEEMGEIKEEMRRLTEAYVQTAQYMLLNNKKLRRSRPADSLSFIHSNYKEIDR